LCALTLNSKAWFKGSSRRSPLLLGLQVHPEHQT
jgi:hypothetical protein